MAEIIEVERAARILIRWGYDGSAMHLKAVVQEMKRRIGSGEVSHG